MRRFWDMAGVESGEEAFGVLLDAKPVRLPGGDRLRVPTAALAAAVAAEWQAAGGAKGGEMSFADVPLTRLAGTAQERIAPHPAPVVDALAKYAESDLLCYRAERPDVLVHRQARAWQPWLDWAALTYDAPLRVTSGVVHVKQDRQALAALHHAVAVQDPWALAGLGILVPALGSLVLGLAVAEGGLDAAEAFALSVLDDMFQTELWGEDAEAAERRRRVGEDVALAARFIRLSRPEAVP